jgi:hypothetical protein
MGMSERVGVGNAGFAPIPALTGSRAELAQPMVAMASDVSKDIRMDQNIDLLLCTVRSSKVTAV